MKALATTLGVLALSAAFGLVSAQDRPAEQPDPTPSGEQPTVPPEREPDVRALGDLLASFVKAYNAKDAKALGDLFTADAEIEDEDGAVTAGARRDRRSVHGHLRGGQGRRAHRRVRLPAVPRGRRRDRGGHGVALDRGRHAAGHQPVQRDLRPPGRPLAPRADPRRAARRRPARPAPGPRVDARRVGQRERRRGRSDHLHVVEGRQLPAPRLRRQGRGTDRPDAAPSASAGTPSASSSARGSSTTGAGSPRG